MRRMLQLILIFLLNATVIQAQDSTMVRAARPSWLTFQVGGFYPSAFHNRFAAGVTLQPFARMPLAVTAGVMTQRARSLSLDELGLDFPVLGEKYRSRAWMLGLRYYPFQGFTAKGLAGIYVGCDAGQQYERLLSIHIYALSGLGTVLYERIQLGWWLSLGSRHDFGRRFFCGAAVYVSGNQLQERAPASRILSGEIAVGLRL